MACPDAVQLITEQRLELQRQGIISGRTYPAQIVISYSGECQGVSDFLTARIFSAVHPNGQPFECYIITSVIGRDRILERVHSTFPDLKKSIDSMVIALPTDPSGSAAFDIGLLPKLLFEKLDLRIVNHDGGQRVLRDFCRAGVVAQVNLTLCRRQPLIDIIHKYEDLFEIGSDAHIIDGSHSLQIQIPSRTGHSSSSVPPRKEQIIQKAAILVVPFLLLGKEFTASKTVKRMSLLLLSILEILAIFIQSN